MTIAAEKAARLPLWLLPWCLFLFLVPFKQLIPGGPFVVLELGAAFLLALVPGRAVYRATWRILAVTVLFLLICLSYFHSIAPDATHMPLLRIGMAFLAYMLAGTVALSPAEFRATLRAWFWGGAAAATALLAFGGSSTGRASVGIGAYVTEPNFFAAELVVPFAIGLYLARDRRARWEAIPLLFLILAGTLATQSRGGLLALIATGLASLAWERRWKLLAAVTTGLTASYMLLAPWLGRYNLANDMDGSHRTHIWEILWPQALEHWLTGTGLNTTHFVTSAIPGFYYQVSAHNTYLQAFVEIGLPGLLALLLVMVTHVDRRAAHPGAVPLYAGLVGLAVAGVFLHMLAIQALWIPWIVASQAFLVRSAGKRHRRPLSQAWEAALLRADTRPLLALPR